jgi:hypothetical protein
MASLPTRVSDKALADMMLKEREREKKILKEQ